MNKILLWISAVFWFLAFASYSGDLLFSDPREADIRAFSNEHYWTSPDFAIRKRKSSLQKLLLPDFLLFDKLTSKLGEDVQLGDRNPEDEARAILKKPTHVAVVVDGNRRWAKENELPRSYGHEKFFTENAPQIIQDAFDLGVNTLTLWCFSTENWTREKEEVDNLMNYFQILVDKLESLAAELDFRVIHLGRKDKLDPILAKKISGIEEVTKNNNNFTLNLAIDYGGQDEIVRAVKKLHEQSFDFNKLTRDHITANLDTASQSFPSPDLIIRTSHIDKRTSGLMAWQSENSELHLSKCYAPDLNKKHLIEGVRDFGRRKRTYS